MFIADIKRVVEQVSRDKGIDRNVLIDALEEALRSAARKKFGNNVDIEVQYSDDLGEIEVFQFKEVVETIEDPELEIELKEGQKLDPECVVGDSLGVKMDTTSFGRIAAQSAKQVIIQKMKDAERDAVYSNFIDRKGEIINGIVQRLERGNIIVNLGHTEGILPIREQVPRESYRRGDRIRAYIMDVLHETRGPQIILSRTHPTFVIDLFKTEVPEISEGIVNIVAAAREPGIRAKIAVSSNDSDIDPVGACVGMKGSRVQNVVQELRGEKIDIIPWHVDTARFVCNALAPAEISRVIIDEENRAMEVIVPDDFLSVAIGKRGQNVRLASKLTGWQLDVKSETRYSEAMQTGYDSLVQMEGISMGLADALYESGFFSAEELTKASVEDLTQIRDVDEEQAVELIAAAERAVVAAEAAAAAAAEAAALEAAAAEAAAAEAAAQDEDASAAEPTGDDEPLEKATDGTEATEAEATEAEAAAQDEETSTGESSGDDEPLEKATDGTESTEAEAAEAEAAAQDEETSTGESSGDDEPLEKAPDGTESTEAEQASSGPEDTEAGDNVGTADNEPETEDVQNPQTDGDDGPEHTVSDETRQQE